MNRRNFIKNSGLFGLSLAGSSLIEKMVHYKNDYLSNRPLVEDRTFRSEGVEEIIKFIKPQIKDPQLSWMFENCYPNTIDTTVDFEIINGKPDTFIITGDIDAMWLRDSTAQVWPYLPLVKKDTKIKNLVKGLINRQAKCVIRDPYANSFYKDLSKTSAHNKDIPTPIPGVHEQKWEVDSLCYVIRLSYHYYKLTNDNTIFDDTWIKSARIILKTFLTEQRKNGKSSYKFVRYGSAMVDAPLFSGTGRPFKPNGLICSMFRPSDDATMYPFLIPSNIFASTSMKQLSEIFKKEDIDINFSQRCNSLSKEIDSAIKKHAVKEHLDFGKIYAYEIDGFGNNLFMDDANVPSLMSLGYLDSKFLNDEIYLNTRKFLLSENNPYFLKGKSAEGQASPHTGKDKIWPMGIILRAMTSSGDNEIKKCIKMLVNTHAGTGFMHEAFDKDNPENYYRSWFAWANTLFGELIIKVQQEKPHLLKEIYSV
jgi:meiotically up-regulated gene 157 (Mug157) protein